MLIGLCLATSRAEATRTGFQGFAASYQGGYSIVIADQNTSGPATIRIRTPRNGRSAQVTWINTFYNETGAYRIALHWRFLPNGTFSANTIDPRQKHLAGTGTFAINRNHPVPFSAMDASGSVKAEGKFRLIGGGAISIAVTLTGIPGGAVTYGFTGSRR
ncbi:MAG: hypothetical protein ACREKL_16425 [Chthoniobacterales bacterium]